MILKFTLSLEIQQHIAIVTRTKCSLCVEISNNFTRINIKTLSELYYFKIIAYCLLLNYLKLNYIVQLIFLGIFTHFMHYILHFENQNKYVYRLKHNNCIAENICEK